jgi:Tfp pilus assembly protein PilN
MDVSLHLLPREMKQKAQKSLAHKESLKFALASAAIFLILLLGTAKNLQNKAVYLERLKAELGKVAKEAKPLEEMDKRLRLLNSRSQDRLATLAIIKGISQTIPAQLVLSSLAYEEKGQVTLHGQTQDLNSVFDFVSKLEKTPAFSHMNIKVRYATQKMTQSGDIVDFEILCTRGR